MRSNTNEIAWRTNVIIERNGPHASWVVMMPVINILGISHHGQMLSLAGNKHYRDWRQQSGEGCIIHILAAMEPFVSCPAFWSTGTVIVIQISL